MIERALCPVLIGREPQLTLLEDALLAANRGQGQIVTAGWGGRAGKNPPGHRVAGTRRQGSE